MSRADEDPFVTIRVTTDPVAADLMKEMLAEEGIQAVVINPSMGVIVGVAHYQFEIPIRVRRSQAEVATELLESMDDYDAVFPYGEDGPAVSAEEMERMLDRADEGEAEATGAGPYRSIGGSEAKSSERSKYVAAGVAALLTFGSGHFYARNARAGLLLALVELSALALLMGTGWSVAWFGVIATVVADMVGSSHAVDVANGVERRGWASALEKHASLFALAFAALWLLPNGLARHFAPAWYVSDEITDICEVEVRCEVYPSWFQGSTAQPLPPEKLATCRRWYEDEVELHGYDADSVIADAEIIRSYASCDPFEDSAYQDSDVN